MYIISKTKRIQDVAKQWRKEYSFMGRWFKRGTQETYKALLDVGQDSTAAQQIEDIIGNTSWTANKCDECGRDVELLIHFGKESDCDTVWADLCLDCLREGVGLLEEKGEML